MESTTGAPRLHRSIWYMGTKSRVLRGFLEEVLEEELSLGGTVLDLMSGSGVVSAFCAGRYRVFANEVQHFGAVIARSLIEHPAQAERKGAFLAAIEPRRDLEAAYRRNHEALAAHYAPALEREADLLEEHAAGGGPSWTKRYRRFLEEPGGVYPVRRKAASGLYAAAAPLLGEGAMAVRRGNPRRRPASLATAFYANVYFGLRQAIELDSLRAAIDELDPGDSFFAEKRIHYLSALLHAASVMTSGTSHFAQPRHLEKDAELAAMAKRRRLAAFPLLEEYSREIGELVQETSFLPGNRAFRGDWSALVEDGRFSLPAAPDLVYLDPPYTADNYSRFYHVLEALAAYDYPPLERDEDGRVLRGRYPPLAVRFQSAFCQKARVEEAFRQVLAVSAASGAKLIISYSSPSGLLLKRYAAERQGVRPLARFEALCREFYRNVSTRTLPLLHSGQGDKNLEIEELLVICKEPRNAEENA
jgi:adenine-specific DNA-methyltransferase